MADGDKVQHPIERVRVRLKVGDSLLAGSDDPLFLGLRGRSGREFRLKLDRGRSLRRGSEDEFVLGAPGDPATNVAHPELNDPTHPSLDLAQVESAYVRKGFEPIPNVRAVAEMDDRLEILEIAVEVSAEGQSMAARFARKGPIWLGLVSGLHLEIPRDAGE